MPSGAAGYSAPAGRPSRRGPQREPSVVEELEVRLTRCIKIRGETWDSGGLAPLWAPKIDPQHLQTDLLEIHRVGFAGPTEPPASLEGLGNLLGRDRAWHLRTLRSSGPVEWVARSQRGPALDIYDYISRVNAVSRSRSPSPQVIRVLGTLAADPTGGAMAMTWLQKSA